MTLKLQNLRQKIEEAELDALLISSPENRRYMSGFTGSAGWLLISPHNATLATDFRYIEQAGRQSPEYEVRRTAPGLAWFPEWTAEHAVKRIGFESQDVTVAVHQAFSKAAGRSRNHQPPRTRPHIRHRGAAQSLQRRRRTSAALRGNPG